MKLNENKLVITVDGKGYPPVFTNNGWALDILAPQDLYLERGKEFCIESGLTISMPRNMKGSILSKLKGEFSINKGEVIHPEFFGQLELALKYIGHSSDRIPAGTPICQLVLSPVFKAEDYMDIQIG